MATTVSDLQRTTSDFPMDTCEDVEMKESMITNTTVIDGKYLVVKRLDVNEIAQKVVFLVRSTSSSDLFVLKLFLPSETNDFLKEV